MHKTGVMLLLATCLVAPVVVRAQSSPANPVVASAQEIFDRQSKYIMSAAEEMPGDKYGYRPTPDQWTFGKVVAHVAGSNFAVCALLSGMPAPQNQKAAETDPKEKIIPVVKASFDFCSQALAALQDSKLGDTVKFFGGRQEPRARVLLELTGDLEDHYSQIADYLRQNGIVPPSAKK